MTEKKPFQSFQTFFLSQEVSNCPLLIEIIKLEKRIQEMLSEQEARWCISCAYGKRILITAENKNEKNITQEDIVEVVDYDPFKNIVLVIGRKKPCTEIPVHWIIQKARSDITFIVEIADKKLYQQIKTHYPSTERDIHTDSIDRAKDILKLLRDNKTVLIKNHGVFITGFNQSEIEKTLETIKRR